jgi:2-polyprenyl-6-methoxyphenol hydroxylase-like FAD-dependent oxidoreductase
MRVAIVGGSAAGLFTALLLHEAGHDVVVLDRDDISPAADVGGAAAKAFRAAAPQIVQPHAVLPLCRELLLERLPAVHSELLAAGVVEAPFASQVPPSLTHWTPQPGDERITMYLTRRSTIDWVLRRVVAATRGIEVRSGEQATGLIADDARLPRVSGVMTAAGPVRADLVVDASGRRTPIDRWLADIGARPTALEQAECGLAYYSRHYALGPVDQLPGAVTTRILAPLDEFTVGIWCGDNSTALIALAPMVEDKRFRAAQDPATFTAVLRTLPVYSAWLDAMTPTTDIFPMGGLHNTLRRFVMDAEPVALGVVGVGDVICTTNPTLGRGLSLALRGAIDLADALRSYAGDLHALALHLDEAIEAHIAPFYRDQAASDAARLAALRHNVFGAPAPVADPRSGRVNLWELRSAGMYDETALRAMWRLMGMLALPDDICTDPDVVEHTRRVIAEHGYAPSMPQPTTEELNAALGV